MDFTGVPGSWRRDRCDVVDAAEGRWSAAGDVALAIAASWNGKRRPKYRNRTLLLPGDAEKQAERAMLKENSEEDLHADVLKVGHHGSMNSTTQEFLKAVRPQVAIISAGEDNPYGHPSPELLERLQTAGARVLRTDGAVHILTDGDKLEISCFVACDNLTTATVSGSAQVPDQDHNRKQ
jgi:hypothetical protein